MSIYILLCASHTIIFEKKNVMISYSIIILRECRKLTQILYFCSSLHHFFFTNKVHILKYVTSNYGNFEYVQNIRKRAHFFKLSVISAFRRCILAEKKLTSQQIFFFKNVIVRLT